MPSKKQYTKTDRQRKEKNMMKGKRIEKPTFAAFLGAANKRNPIWSDSFVTVSLGFPSDHDGWDEMVCFSHDALRNYSGEINTSARGHLE